MLRLDPNDENARAQVKRFCECVHDLRMVHDIIRELFDDEQAQLVMEKTAHHFFFDLNRIVIEYFLLQMAKLTDPASSSTREGRAENFTIANLLESIHWPEEVLGELDKLDESAVRFRAYINEARNKLLAHYDKDAFLSGRLLGSFPEGEDEKIMNALEEMCNVLYEASSGEIYGRMVCAHPGDVRDLKGVLRNALAFEKLLHESKGADLQRLQRCLENVNKGNV